MSKCISIGLFFSSLILIQMPSLVFAAGYCPNGCYNETNRPCELVTCSSSRSNSNSNSSTQGNRTSNQNYEPAARAVGQLLDQIDQMNRDQAAADEREQRSRAIEEERSRQKEERSRQEEAANNARKQYEEQQAQERLRSAEQDASLNPWGNNDSNKSKSKNEIHAPHLANNCVKILQHGRGISDMYKVVKNNCGMPVQVLVCFYGYKGATRDCSTDVGWGLVGTIPAGSSEETADVAGEHWRARYQVCDMRNNSLLCVRQ